MALKNRWTMHKEAVEEASRNIFDQSRFNVAQIPPAVDNIDCVKTGSGFNALDGMEPYI
jgi:hypothetical protein